MQISIIAALADNNVIGKANKLPWHMPADLKHFKAITLGKPVIMGRKTYEFLGKPLSERRNIVITRDKTWHAPGCEIYHSLEAALTAVTDYAEVMILGGAEIYQKALPLADRMYLTFIHQNFVGDTYFPNWKENEWQEIERGDYPADAENAYSYSFVILQRTCINK